MSNLPIGLDAPDLFSALDPHLYAPLAICLGAVPGALSRYYLIRLFSQWFRENFPYGTFFVNMTGALTMGFFTTLMVERAIANPFPSQAIASYLQLLIGVGFLGSYTTFSTYALNTSNLLSSGKQETALFYGLTSAVLGLIGLTIGSIWAKSFSL
jgi:fluoride exporter